MPAPYEIRAGGDVKNKKQSMADLKLRRLNELNSRLKEDLERPRIKVSEASMSCVSFPTSFSTAQPRPVKYCQNTKDFMVPSLWGQVSHPHTRPYFRTSASTLQEIKQLKKLVRDIIDPGRDLGHVDGRPRSEPSTAPVASSSQAQAQGQAPAASASVTQQAEIMVADIMSALPKELTRNGGEDRARDQGTPAETSASKSAENMVADIMTSFREGVRKKDSVAAIGGTGKQGGTHSARRACDDCK
ncbi:MAG: hypothetical protein Q9193_000021 [Seirophora villosa]